jgi:hypothetical protein
MADRSTETILVMLLLSLFLTIGVPAIIFLVVFYQGTAAESVDYQTIADLPSPDWRWDVTIRDRRHEYGLFPIVVIDSFTDLRPGLRPEARWIGADRLCVVAPHIDNMAVRSGKIDGAQVDVHVLPWDRKSPPPKIALDELCK